MKPVYDTSRGLQLITVDIVRKPPNPIAVLLYVQYQEANNDTSGIVKNLVRK